MKKITIKKGDILQAIGDLNTKVYQVEKGLLRSYCIDQKGKEHIFMFAPEGWTIADTVDSQVPAELFIDAIEHTVVRVYKKDIDREDRNVAKFIRRLHVLQKRVIMLMSYSAIQRYDHFMETYPEIAQRVPQRMIASYLGITPEALSKVKNNRLKKKP
ncbi:MAG: Crp/Fnr family transcriptional regulator [Bacteroidota bacterium]